MSAGRGNKAYDEGIPFNAYGLGVNVAEDATSLRDGEVQQATNAILNDVSFERRPGMDGIVETTGIDSFMRGMFRYLQKDGTDDLIGVWDGDIWQIGKSSGTLTALTNSTTVFSGDDEAWGRDYKDKLWIANGTGVFKVEPGTPPAVYQVGIDPPSGFSATAVAGSGTLTAGDYQIFATYSRKVDGSHRLYSIGEDLGTVTISGTQEVQITATASTDPQVTNIVIFMTDANGTTFYYYKESANANGTFNIASDSERNAAITYSSVAVTNSVPPAFDYLWVHDNRVWGAIDDILYYSLKGLTVYDLERFPELNFIQMPYAIRGIFNIGMDLYVNTLGGIVKLPNSDVNVRWRLVDDRYYFWEFRATARWINTVIGLTNDGIRIFNLNGDDRFSSIDLSYKIRPAITQAYNFDADYRPCCAVYQRADREEFHFCFRDDVTFPTNNKRWILNLSTWAINGFAAAGAAWEEWTASANYMVVDTSRAMYSAQSHISRGTVYKEKSGSSLDDYIYDSSGSLLTVGEACEFIIITRDILLGLDLTARPLRLRQLVKSQSPVVATITFRDKVNTETSVHIGGTVGDPPLFDVALFDSDVFPGEKAEVSKAYPQLIKGKIFNIKYTQQSNDPNLEVLQGLLSVNITRSTQT